MLWYVGEGWVYDMLMVSRKEDKDNEVGGLYDIQKTKPTRIDKTAAAHATEEIEPTRNIHSGHLFPHACENVETKSPLYNTARPEARLIDTDPANAAWGLQWSDVDCMSSNYAD